jgi:hypothetical protein
MIRIGSPHFPPLHPAKYVILTHDLQHPLMIHDLMIALELLNDLSITMTWKLLTNRHECPVSEVHSKNVVKVK